MATVNITIPLTFFQQMNQFMATVQKMQQLSNQLVHTTRNQVPVQQLFSAHASTKSQFQKMLHVFRKLSASMQRSVESIMRAMGATGQSYMRKLAMLSEALGPIINITVSTVTLIGGIAVSAFTTGSLLMRWFWDKMVGLGDAMLGDFLEATGSFSSIAGLRAWRSTFGNLLGDPNVLENTTIARGSASSSQFIALQMLGIKHLKDTTDMMVQATLAAKKFMDRQQRGFELRMAQAFAITSLFSPTALARLEQMDEEELVALKKMYDQYKPLMQLTEKAVMGWMRFSMQVKAAEAQIISVIAEELASPSHPFVQAVKHVTEALTHLIKAFSETPAMKYAVKFLGEQIDALAKWLSNPATKKDVLKLILDIGDIINYIKDAIKYIKEMIEIWRGPVPTKAQVPVFRPGMRRPGALVRDPKTGQLVEPSKVQVFRPGVRRPGAVRPGAVRPGSSEVSGATGSSYNAPALKAPTSPSEAPETVEQAVKGGYMRSGGDGVINRDRFRKELAENPALRAKIARIAANEQGDNPDGQTAILESMMNRAEVRHTSLADQAKWHESEGGYYQQGNMGRGVLENPARNANVQRSIDRALGGSNVSNYATDNSSGNLAKGEIASGRFLYRQGINGETFSVPSRAEQPKNARSWEQWRASLPPADPRKFQGFTTDDIQHSIQSDKGNVVAAPEKGNASTSTAVVGGGDVRMSTVGNYRLGGDARRQALLDAAAQASKNLPPGWRVEAYSGQRDGSGQGPHAHSGAIDFRLIDPNGHMIENYQHPENFAVYERFAQDTHAVLQKTNPELAAQHRWGGYFSGGLGPSGTYGAMDLMHQDFAGGNSRMAAGQWETGINEGWRRRWGVDEHSSGIVARAAERERLSHQIPDSPKYSKPPPWPEDQRAKPWDSSLYEPSIRVRSLNQPKVDNRSDEDVSAAKTNSDNDDGESSTTNDADALAAGEAAL